MKKLITTSVLVMLALVGFAQQDAHYTQFMFNKLYYNPAYAGSKEVASLSGIHRSQWLDFEGAPNTQTINFHTPAFNNRVGLGLSITRDQIGVQQRYNTNLSYAYRLKLGSQKKGTLSLGVQGVLSALQVDWSDLEATHGGDGQIPTDQGAKFTPNFGAGAYYNTDRFYVGLSVPHFLRTSVDFDSEQGTQKEIVRDEIHTYLMAGIVFDIAKNVKFKPAFLAKYAVDAPFDMDINASFLFIEKLWVGATYRLGGSGTGESIDALIQYQVTPALRIGGAYDFTLSDLNDYNNGSFEVMLEYCFKYKGAKLENPRFF